MCEKYGKCLSGCPSRRIALGNDELIPRPPSGQTLCWREGEAPVTPRTAQRRPLVGEGAGTGQCGQGEKPIRASRRSPPGPRRGARVVPYGWLRDGHPPNQAPPWRGRDLHYCRHQRTTRVCCQTGEKKRGCRRRRRSPSSSFELYGN